MGADALFHVEQVPGCCFLALLFHVEQELSCCFLTLCYIDAMVQ